MPKSLEKAEEFIKLAEKTDICLVKRLKDKVKLKLRSGRYLYTFQTTPKDADAIIKDLKCDVEEL